MKLLFAEQKTQGQVWSSAEPHHKVEDVLYPWRTQGKGVVRVKRDWIIPPIRVLENSKQVPEDLVQIKSDKIFTGDVIYKLEGPGVDQDPKNLFEIDDITGVIRCKRPLDRERHNSFTLKAFALSPSGERLENPTIIEIVVLDQNDNRPAFTQKQFGGSVSEFSVPGTSVMSVSATDADDPMTENAYLSYSIIGQESIPANAVNKTMFGINNETGAIYTRDVGLDREVVTSFRLKLQIADMGGMGLTGESVAIIHVSDINNHAPQFSPAVYSMAAVENRKDYEIGRVNVTDRDDRGAGNWEARYFISNDPEGNFAISTDPGSNEGVLTVVKPLDYESQNEHILVLTVENVNRLSNKAPNFPVSSATVVVIVMNENEAPLFREDPIKIVVPESVVPGTLLKSNIAFDPDHSDLRYEMSRDPERWLEINRDTGDITAKRTFNMRSPNVRNNVYNAVVKVTDAGGVSTTARVAITLKETNDFPPQLFPLSGTVCRGASHRGSGLVVTAVDEDLPPHAAPFAFDIPGDLSINWTVNQVNNTHAVLQPLVELQAGEYAVTVFVSDSGSPLMSAYAQLNVTVCVCDSFGDCKSEAGAVLGSSVGISFIALIIIMASIALLLLLLLLAVAVTTCGRRHHIKKGSGLLVGESEDDIRDNVFNYDEQGGGEEDENGFSIDLLWNPHDAPSTPGSYYPRGKQPLRRDAPHNLPSPIYPRRPPADPTDIEDYINDGLEAADNDPNVPPYDTALIYDYEGEGSLTGSLSSVASGSSDGDQDYDYLNDWGPRFQKLANMFDPC
ncbi:cadherin-15 isoform X2 [Pseudoliparis swirei]|uniref:cadherin-15 isoform X2 n=1 Tax=Pseudoliparis swirei TaxID=2059687 RepID=UPI0024BDD54A|nr:cadherin-15 isoform X2 [Pseudoliparis swirei]XP_056267891.1 cadherin-15 isoform X2 [Pseudoliparis swirei]XP_056267892.1 cadherin-15 isoform X2 [Pseudoliparis swirei]XP_056267895.1 cadherin-15 isoform X2 [Pseudoliparis swirei]